METLWVIFIYGTIALPAAELLLLLAWAVRGRPAHGPFRTPAPTPPLQFRIQDFLVAGAVYALVMVLLDDSSENVLAGVRLLFGAAAALDVLRLTPVLDKPLRRGAFLLVALFAAAYLPVVVLAAWYVWRRLGARLAPIAMTTIDPRPVALAVLILYGVAFGLPVENSADPLYGVGAYAVCLDELNTYLMHSVRGPFTGADEYLLALCWLANPALWFSVQSLLRAQWKRAALLGLAATGLSVILLLDGSAPLSPGYGLWMGSMGVAAVLPALCWLTHRRRAPHASEVPPV